jgi:superoxide reductase
MTERGAVYRCFTCGNIVEVLHAAAGELNCCGLPMERMQENTQEASLEKHLPVVRISGPSVEAEVGSVPHPMEEKHHIEWIEVQAGDRVFRRYLRPGEPAKASFMAGAEHIVVREYCNLHGLWRT